MGAQVPNGEQPADERIPPVLPVIPDHELLRCIGQGSYGQVWLVRSVLGTYRAAKVVFRKSFKSALPFEREFRGIFTYEPISRSHDGLVDVLQVGRNDAAGCFYYVMELGDDQFTKQAIDPEMYSAKTIETELQLRGRLPVEECIEIGAALASALMHLHRHGMVHRDIKPANIIFVNGQVKLADIGLVADVREAKTIVGTDGFMAPEGPGTPQADIYSLGKVLYEMATGKDRLDYPAPSTRLGEFADRRELRHLAKVIYRACAPTVRERYPTAAAMEADLLRLKRGGTGAGQPRRAPLSSWSKVLIGLGAAVIALIGLLIGLMLLVGPNPDKADLAEAIQMTTNASAVPLPVADLSAQEILSDTVYAVVKLRLSPALVRSREATRMSLPEGANRAEWPDVFRAFPLRAEEFKLVLPGYSNVPALKIASRPELDEGLSRVVGSNNVVTVFAVQTPRKLITTAVFKAPRKILEEESCSAVYHRENTFFPIMVNLGRPAPGP